MNEKKNKINQEEIKKSGNKKLSQRKKILLMFIFIIGIPLSYPTIFPLGLICTSILLFQKNQRVNYVAIFLIIMQIIILLYFGFVYTKVPFIPNY